MRVYPWVVFTELCPAVPECTVVCAAFQKVGGKGVAETVNAYRTGYAGFQGGVFKYFLDGTSAGTSVGIRKIELLTAGQSASGELYRADDTERGPKNPGDINNAGEGR
jgi:hypothetical protein